MTPEAPTSDGGRHPPAVGAQVRRWRTERGLTLARLAGATGLNSHPGDEHHLVLSGRLRMTQGEHVAELGPGDYLRWDGMTPHIAETIGDEPASLLVIRLTRHGEPHD